MLAFLKCLRWLKVRQMFTQIAKLCSFVKFLFRSHSCFIKKKVRKFPAYAVQLNLPEELVYLVLIC